MNGRTNAKNGAGAIRDGCAVLEIKAPAYSQITAVRADGLTKRQGKGYIDLSNNNFWFYYIIIQKFELSNLEWTVTATFGTDSASETVFITTQGQIKVVLLSFKTYLVRDGNVIAELVATHGSVTKVDDAAKWSPGGYVSLLKANIDVTRFTKIVLEVSAGSSWHGGQIPGVGCSNTDVTVNTSSGVVSQYYAYDFLNSSSGSIPANTHEVDILNIEGEKTIWISLSYGSGGLSNPYVSILNWYLE